MPDAAKCEKALALLEAGANLRAVATQCDLALTTLHRWLNSADYAERYARAREAACALLAEELLEIADDGRNDWVENNDPDNPGYRLNGEHVQRSRVRLDTRKWLLSKMLPKVYGDKLMTENTTTHKFDGAKDTLAAKINRAFDSGTEGEAG